MICAFDDNNNNADDNDDNKATQRPRPLCTYYWVSDEVKRALTQQLKVSSTNKTPCTNSTVNINQIQPEVMFSPVGRFSATFRGDSGGGSSSRDFGKAGCVRRMIMQRCAF